MQSLKNEIVTPEMTEIRTMIIDTVKQRESIKNEMEEWYHAYPGQHFPKMHNLIVVDATLSKLDSYYKQLWDYHNMRDK
jgi:hypothetical protein